MKKFICGLLVGLILATCVTVYAVELVVKENTFPILVNGVVQNIEAYNINGYTFIKLSQVGLATNCEVSFNTEKQQIEITTGVLKPTVSSAIPQENEDIPEETGGDNMEEWVLIRDFKNGDNADVISQIVSDNMSIFPKTNGEEVTLNVDGHDLRVKVINSKTYFNKTDLRAIGLIN